MNLQPTTKPAFIPGTEIPVSFQFSLCNVDVVRIESRKNLESIVILYLGNAKAGFIYEGSKLSQEKQFEVFKNLAPDNKNDLRDFVIKYSEKYNYYTVQPDNYVFVADNLVERTTKNNFKIQ